MCVHVTTETRLEAAESSPLFPPTRSPSHQVGGRQSTLIGQLRLPVPCKTVRSTVFQPPHPHLPTPAYPCCDYQRPVPNRELPPDINSHAIILIPLWWAFAENLKQWLRISGNVSHCELVEASAQSYMKTDAVNVIGNQWGQNSHTRQH